MTKQCQNSEKFLLGIANKVHLRRGATNGHKIMRIVARNYIIPYSDIKDENWFITCDGYFVHRNEVRIISKKNAFRKLKK